MERGVTTSKAGGRRRTVGGAGGLGGPRDLGFVLSGVHLPFLGERTLCGWGGGRGYKLSPSGTGRTRGVCGGVVVPTVGTVRGGGGAAAGDRAEVTFFGAGGIGTPVLGLPVVESADGTDRVVVFADWCGVAIPLTVPVAGGLGGRVGDFDLSLTGEEEDVGAHLFSLLGGGRNHH